MAAYPDNLKYTKEHEWLKLEGNQGTIGITKFAIEQLGDVVYLDLPKVGKEVKQGEAFGTIESTKTVSDLYSPVNGKVTEINQALIDSPEKISEDPHTQGWLVKIQISSQPTALMGSSDYETYLKSDAGH